HASNNTNDGINMFDGIDGIDAYSGPKGNHFHSLHPARQQQPSNWETLRFLPSNARWWKDTFDGYRFDSVTSMMYLHHGL
ncbi:starch branching enzyme IIb, partial [Haematococcus lacustris]